MSVTKINVTKTQKGGIKLWQVDHQTEQQYQKQRVH